MEPCVLELLQHTQVGVHAHRLLREPQVHRLGVRLHEPAFTAGEPQHEQLVILAGIDPEGTACVPVGYDAREEIMEYDRLVQPRRVAGLQGLHDVTEESFDVGFAHGLLALGVLQWTRRKTTRLPPREG